MGWISSLDYPDLLTVVFGLQVDTFKITSNAKVLNTKVVRLVETSNFDFWVIVIRGDMRKLEPKYCTKLSNARQRTLGARVFAPERGQKPETVQIDSF